MRGGGDGALTVFLCPQGDTLNCSCYVDLDQTSTVSKKISEVTDIPPKIIES